MRPGALACSWIRIRRQARPGFPRDGMQRPLTPSRFILHSTPPCAQCRACVRDLDWGLIECLNHRFDGTRSLQSPMASTFNPLQRCPLPTPHHREPASVNPALAPPNMSASAARLEISLPCLGPDGVSLGSSLMYPGRSGLTPDASSMLPPPRKDDQGAS